VGRVRSHHCISSSGLCSTIQGNAVWTTPSSAPRHPCSSSRGACSASSHSCPQPCKTCSWMRSAMQAASRPRHLAAAAAGSAVQCRWPKRPTNLQQLQQLHYGVECSAMKRPQSPTTSQWLHQWQCACNALQAATAPRNPAVAATAAKVRAVQCSAGDHSIPPPCSSSAACAVQVAP
jgi:hypothetical protein